MSMSGAESVTVDFIKVMLTIEFHDFEFGDGREADGATNQRQRSRIQNFHYYVISGTRNRGGGGGAIGRCSDGHLVSTRT